MRLGVASGAVPRIVILDDYQRVALHHADWDRLPADCVLDVLHEPLTSTEDLVAALAGAEVVIAMRERTRFDADRLARLPDLRLLITTGMQNAAIDLDAAAARGVLVCGTGGRARSTVELAWALILALARSIPREDAGVRLGGWQETVGFELDGATLGLVGLGRLGSLMVPVARAFGMDVLAWSRNLDPAHADEVGARAVTKEQLFAQSDVISVHYKLGPESTGLVGAEDLARMRPTAYLVNTSRGPVVDADALLEALERGAIAGAGLDVYDEEPLPTGHPLRTSPRTVLTPHLGYVTNKTYDVFFGEALDDVLAWLDDAPVRVLTR
jgi:phosphoglycerate dehydrogenase-like enzyme